jgi:undecaprenyl-diphosphatase
VSASTLTYRDTLILGLVEGVTEFLPVSSTGHLILTTRLLGLDRGEPLTDASGRPIMVAHKGTAPQPLTLKDAVDNYDIIIQGGAILAVLLLYWGRVWSIVRGILGRDPAGLLLFRNLFVAFLPAAVVGLALEKWISTHLTVALTVLAAQVVGAVLMLAVEYWRKNRTFAVASSSGPELHELSLKQSLSIGLWQVGSLWPGMSRSMVVIVGGYLAGLRPARAAEFSFLLGLITLGAASAYKTLKHGSELVAGLHVGPMLFGFVVATIAAAVAVKGLVHWLTRHGLAPFAWYRIALAVVWVALIGW